MKVLSYSPKDILPGILFDKESEKFQIFGKSCPENAVEFYEPVFQWIDEYILNPNESTVIEFRMTYINSVSVKTFLIILKKLEDLAKSGHDLKVRWFYKDWEDDLEELGMDFKNTVNLNFEMHPLKDKADNSKSDNHFNDLMDEIL